LGTTAGQQLPGLQYQTIVPLKQTVEIEPLPVQHAAADFALKVVCSSFIGGKSLAGNEDSLRCCLLS